MYLRTNKFTFTTVLCFAMAVVKHEPKATWGRKGLFRLAASRCHEGKSEQEFKAGIWIQELN